MEINKKDVGLRIKKIRLTHNYTMESFGKLIGAPKSAVNNWEKGRNLPSSERLEKIAILANTNVESIIFGSFAEQVNDYLLDLLLNFDDSNVWLSDDLSNYLDFYEQHSKFKNFSSEKIAKSGLSERRDMALKGLSHLVIKKILESDKNIDVLTPELINKNLKLVFEDITNTPDLSNYGMLKMVERNVSWVISELSSTYSGDEISPELRKELISRLKITTNYINSKFK